MAQSIFKEKLAMMTKERMLAEPVKRLLIIHNSILTQMGPTSWDSRLSTWKKSKTLLVDKILGLQDEAHAALRAMKAAKKQTSKSRPKSKPGSKSTRRRGDVTIRSVALGLLCTVAYYEDRDSRDVVKEGTPNCRTVGLPYDKIIQGIKDRFPDCKTTPACLRWYCVKVRAGEAGYEDMRLPQRRPRVESSK